MSSVEDTKVDTFVDDLFQYAINDFFSFMEHCMNVILQGWSLASITYLLNHYIVGIASIGGEEKEAPYRVIMDKLKSDAEALSKTRNTVKFNIIKVNFRRLLEEQLRLWEEA